MVPTIKYFLQVIIVWVMVFNFSVLAVPARDANQDISLSTKRDSNNLIIWVLANRNGSRRIRATVHYQQLCGTSNNNWDESYSVDAGGTKELSSVDGPTGCGPLRAKIVGASYI